MELFKKKEDLEYLSMTKNCILCDSKNIISEEYYRTNDINHLYKNILNIDSSLPKNQQISLIKCISCGVKFFNPMYQGSEKFYEILQNFNWYYMEEKQEYILCSKYIPLNSSILEIGSGKAIFSKYLKNKSNYTGLEFNDAAIARANEIGITLLKESIEDHCKRGFKYDAVFSFQVLEHVENPRLFIQSSVECLNINGLLVIAVPNNDGLCGISTNNILDFPPHHMTHWGAESFTNLAKIFNLDLIDLHEEGVSKNHRIWAKKTIIYNYINKIFGVKHGLLDLSKFAKINSFISSILARFLPINIDKTVGHTLVGVFRKSS